jgi:hypothetical protein
MIRKALIAIVCSLVVLAGSPALLRAQGGPPPGPPPFGGPGGGRGGFRVLGVEGCLTNSRPVPAGTPGFAASIVRDRKEASFSGTPTDRTNTELAYRDNNGVTYSEITLPALGSRAAQTVICIDDPNLHIRLVVDPNPSKPTAREFQVPDRKPRNGGQPPPFGNRGPNGNGGQNPPPPPGNVTITHPAPPSAVASEISTSCPDATTTQVARTGPDGMDTSLRVFCPSLRLELYSQDSNSHGVSTTTASITATGAGVNLSTLTVPYPLPPNYAVTVVPPGPRGRRGPGPGGPDGPGAPQ